MQPFAGDRVLTGMDITHAPLEESLVRLSDGRMMPQLGIGTSGVERADTAATVADALRAGYRLVDTAAFYDNEVEVGQGLRDSGVARDEVFLTTKVWNRDHGFDETLAAFDASVGRLGVETVDLYLVHWPVPTVGRFVETWRALIRLQGEGRARSIGVSNFRETDLERIIDDTGVPPVLNQIECHPRWQQVSLRGWMEENGIAAESWSPLGPAEVRDGPVVARIAEKHGRSPVQVVIRWHLDQGLIVIPRTGDRAHLIDNLSVGGFALDAEDMAALGALDDPAGRTGFDPATFVDL